MIYTREQVNGLLEVTSKDKGEGEHKWVYLIKDKLQRFYEKQKGSKGTHLVKFSAYGTPEPNTKLFAVGLKWEGSDSITILPHKYANKGDAIGAVRGLMQVPNVLEGHVINLSPAFDQNARILADPQVDPEKFAMLNGECG